MKYKDQSIIDLLESRQGLETNIELKDGRNISVWNIAWGYDLGDEYAHITTNISPYVDNTTIDFFCTDEISKIVTKEE